MSHRHAYLSILALPFLALSLSCRSGDSKEKKELEQELKLLKETRAELQATITKLEPLTKMAEFMESQGLLAALEGEELKDPFGESGDLDDQDDLLDPPTGNIRSPFEEDQANDGKALEDVIKDIKTIDPLHRSLSKSAAERVLENPMALARGARIVPSFKNGEAYGFKIYGIKPDSLYLALGIENGDTIQRINGHDLTSPESALDVYTKLRDAKRLDIDLSRRDKALKLRIDIRD